MRRLARCAPALFVLVVLPNAASPQQVPDDFAIEPYVSWSPDPFNPVGFTFLPDGRVIMIERHTGNVHVATPGATSNTVIATIPDVDASGFEEGLLGVEADPDWPTRPYLYFFYTRVGLTTYITMYPVSGDLTDAQSTNLVFGNPYHLMTDIPNNVEFHNGGTLRFGPDKMLYVSTGDDGSFCDPQDNTVLRGVILRLDVSQMPGTGSGPPPKSDITPVDNPFPGPDENERLVWAWGLRNPFRINVDPVTNDVIIGDVGAALYEEMNIASFTQPGANFGWPQYEGPMATPCCNGCGSTNTFTEPIYAYEHGKGASSVIGGPIYRPGGALDYPSQYVGNIFFLEFYEGWMRRLVPNGSTWQVATPVPGQPTTENWGEGFVDVTDLQLGDDGALYYIMFGPGAGCVCRIVSTIPSDVNDTHGAILFTWVAPNPSTVASGVTIHASMPFAGMGALRIFDSLGRLVRELPSPNELSSRNTYIWNARADNGSHVAAGTYFYHLDSANGTTSTGKFSLLR